MSQKGQIEGVRAKPEIFQVSAATSRTGASDRLGATFQLWPSVSAERAGGIGTARRLLHSSSWSSGRSRAELARAIDGPLPPRGLALRFGGGVSASGTSRPRVGARCEGSAVEDRTGGRAERGQPVACCKSPGVCPVRRAPNWPL